MRPLALVRWVSLTNGRKVTPGRHFYLYVSDEGVVLEAKDGESSPMVFTWDEISSVVLVRDAGTEGASLARVFGS